MPFSENAVVLAPVGRDAQLAAAMLKEAHLEANIAVSIPDFLKQLHAGVGFAVVTEESIASADLRELAALLGDQPEWSDLPFILLTTQGGGLERNPSSARYLETLGNVTFLERPFHPTTFISLASAALRARRRQYQARSSLQAIRRGDEQLRVALSAARLGTWSLNLKTLELLTSTQCKAQFGRGEGVSFGYQDLLHSIHADDWGAVKEQMKAVTDGATEYDVEYRTIWPDASVHWLQIKGGLDQSEQASDPIISGVSLDITAEKESQNALGQSEERFRAAVKAVSGVLWTNSADGQMLGEQPGWTELTGQSFDEYQGFGWSSAIHPDDVQPTIDAWLISVSTSTTFIFEHRVKRRDGSWGRFSVRAIPAHDANGDVREWVGVHTDITEQRLAEQRLAELAETLELRIVEATAELRANEALLRQSQKLETIGQLTGGVAHDFNNLLTPIVSSLEILQRRVAGDDRASALAAAGLQSAERAKILVSRLLAFARRQPLEPRTVDLEGLVAGMMDLISRSIGPSISIRTQMAANLPFAKIDPNQVELCILNLCVNGRDAMPEGGEILILLDAIDVNDRSTFGVDPGGYVRLIVGDTGIGMDNETMQRAIEPFYTTKDVGKGTGLGLSMVHGLTAQLGGGMTIESELGRGTKVSLYFPIADESPDFVDKSAPEEAPVSASHAVILVVDDEPLVRLATRETLLDAGYTVHDASSAVEALEMVENGLRPDILVTDQLMPNLRGSEVATRLQRILPQTRVLIATGYSGSEDLGFPKISKPYGAGELVRRVKEIVDQD